MTIDEMWKSLHSFDDGDFKPLLDGLELKREKAWKVFLGVVFVLGFVVFSFFLHYGMTDFVMISLFGGGIISLFFYRRMAVVRREAKMELMPALCQHIGLHYNINPPNNAITAFSDLSIIPSYDEKILEDEIYGQAGDIDFNLLEANLKTVHRDSKGRKTTRTVFNGFLTSFDFHKNFKGTTIITKDQTMIGNFFNSWGNVGERVKLEDPQFEDRFEVYSTDQVEARYLLTPGFMERVLKFSYIPTIKGVQMAFHNGSVFMAIKKSGNSFEGGSFKLNDPELIKQNIKDVTLIFDIVRELNLTQQTKV